MKIDLITMWYNEEFLAPFFLNHYHWINTIHILLDADTNDNTEEIARNYPNVRIVPFKFPDMLDDIIKSRKINEMYRTITDAEYVIVVDSDEFIFCNTLEASVEEHIINKDKSVYFSTLWQVYQHEGDGLLDSTKPTHLQRCNGDPTIANCYIKPTVARTGLDIVWGYGNHNIVLDGTLMGWNTPNADVMENHGVSVRPADMLQGAHWKLFDLEETIRRRTRNRTDRMSRFNIATNMGHQYHISSSDAVIEEYNRMKSCPIVIKNRLCQNQGDIHWKTIFESILSENDFSEDYVTNFYPDGVDHLLESCDLPEWYALVQPYTISDNVIDENFLLACEYYKQGNREKAIAVLEKALEVSPDNFHYKFYLLIWRKNITISA
jgi:hypothetical protein